MKFFKTLACLLAAALALSAPSMLKADDAAIERTAEMNPDDATSQFNWAVTAMKAKKIGAARKAAKRLVGITPKDPQAWELKGQIELMDKDEKAAADSFEHSVSIDSDRAEAHYQLAKIYITGANNEKGKKELQAYESGAKSKDLKRVISQGVLWSKLGDNAKALKDFEKASQLEGGQDAAARYLCQLYNENGDVKKAEGYCQKAAAQDSASADIDYNLGFAQSRLGKTAAAKQSFQKAVAADPSFAPALYNLGTLDYETGALDAAQKHFRQALDAKGGDYPQAQYNLAVVLGDQGKWQEAAGVYKKILSKDSGNADAKTNLAYVVETGTEALLDKGRDAYENGNFEAATKAWSAVLELDPGNATAADFLKKVKSKSTAKQDSVAKAKKAARLAVAKRLQSEDERVLKEGLASVKEGKLAQAVRLLDFYVRKHPGNAAASQAFFKAKSQLDQQVDDLLQRAGRMLVDDDKAGAKGVIDQALALDPNNSRANKMLAQVTGSQSSSKASADALKKSYFEGVDAYLEGDLPKAIGIWKKVLAQDPGHLDARRSLSQAELELSALQKHK
jgi:tetratricopeptide (TPR) repeat protein